MIKSRNWIEENRNLKAKSKLFIEYKKEIIKWPNDNYTG